MYIGCYVVFLALNSTRMALILQNVRILGILRILIVLAYKGSLLSLIVRITALCATWQGLN